MDKKIEFNFQCLEGTELTIYINDKKIKKVDYRTSSNFTISDFSPFDRLIIIGNNKSGKGGFIGNWLIDGKKYYTNKNLLTLVGLNINNSQQYHGGKDLGCYRDNIDNRTLPTQLPGTSTIQRCHDEAIKNAYPYYALQNGSQCFMGYNYLNAIRIDNQECFMKCIDNKEEYCGGPIINRVYSSFEVPTIKEYETDVEKRDSKIIDKESKWIWIKGNSFSNKILGKWKFEWKYIPQDIEFCPNPKYCEFNPSGCIDIKNCGQTVKKGYKVNKKLCKNKINRNFRGLDSNILESLTKIPKKNRNMAQQNFLRNLYQIYKTSCIIIKEANKTDEYHTLCGLDKIGRLDSFQKKCSEIPLYYRHCPSDISEKYQKINKDSLGEEWLRNICIDNNYCFDGNSKEGPKCYKPKKIDIDNYINFYDYQIPIAIETAGNIINNKNSILSKKWIQQLKKLKLKINQRNI